jgi:bacterioferritin-associated ferredoxin
MYVCVCKAVSDTRIKRLVSEGACTLRDLARETALGSCCGKCVPAARAVLSEALSAQPIRLSELGANPPLRASA